MRRVSTRTFVLALLALCASAGAASGRQAAPQLDWREFKSEAGGFSVKFPSAPSVRTATEQKGPVTFTRHVHAAAAAGGAYEFEVDYMDMPAGYDEPELSLEGGISGFTRYVEGRRGTLLTNGRVARGTCEGREATAGIPNASGTKGFAQARVFNSGQRYYFAVFNSTVDNASARAAAAAFMDSFDIKDGCRAPLIPTAAPTAAPVTSTFEGTPDPATGWRKLAVNELGFGLLMPGAARRESKQAQLQPFELFHHEFVYQTDEAIYSAEVIGDYPEGFHASASSHENTLDVMLHVIKKNLGPLELTFGEPRRLNVGAYPGREYAMTNEQVGARGRVQIYSTPRRVYIFIAISRAAATGARDLERFFSSVRVLPK